MRKPRGTYTRSTSSYFYRNRGRAAAQMTVNTVGHGNGAVALFNADQQGRVVHVVQLSFQPSFTDSIYGQIVTTLIPPVTGTDAFFQNQAESIYSGDPAFNVFAMAGYLPSFPIATNIQLGRNNQAPTVYGNLVDPLAVLLPGYALALATLGDNYIDCMFEFVMLVD